MYVHRLAPAAHPDIGAIGLGAPRELVVAQRNGERFAYDAALQAAIEYGERDFDTAKEVAVHPVGRRQVHVLHTVGIKIEHARMVEKAAHDGAHTDVFRQARHTLAHGARTEHHEIDLHPRLARLV